jgi:hypothetical protein
MALAETGAIDAAEICVVKYSAASLCYIKRLQIQVFFVPPGFFTMTINLVQYYMLLAYGAPNLVKNGAPKFFFQKRRRFRIYAEWRQMLVGTF